MKTIGSYMAIAGIAPIVLLFLDMNLRILMWIDMWGPTIGWTIRLGLVLIGAALFFLSPAEPEIEEGATA